jgi:hypothetical protein
MPTSDAPFDIEEGVPVMEKWHTLRCGAHAVGHVLVTGCDNFYIMGRFRAGPDFAQYEQLLHRAYRLWAEEAREWLDALDEVNELGLCLEDPVSGRVTRIRDFQLEGFSQVHGRQGERVEFKFDL